MSTETTQMREDISASGGQSASLLENQTRKRVKYQDEHVERDEKGGGFKIKTYHPTWAQMKDFSAYMKYIHEDGGHRAGLAKIVPPVGYKPRKKGYEDDVYDMEITCPIRQEVTGEGGLYQQMNIVDKKKMTVRNFKRLSEDKHSTPVHQDQADLQRTFWKNVFTNPSIYGADVPGTLFDDDFEEFNLTKLKTILDDIQGDYGVTIQGVNTTYLYFGMWKSSFCWHTEDMDLYSINYLHTGEPKSWYCIAPEYGRRFERLAESFFPHSFKSCKAFLRHKTTLISPQVLKKYSIPYSSEVQKAGEFMVTFPYSYHSGFNNGFNIAEATNFATEHWIDFGKWATRCECSAESVKISMQTFVKRYQSERYDNWIRGKDVCKDPRDPKHVAAAPRPTEHDLFVMGIHDRYVDNDPYNEGEGDDDRKRVALQQNQSSNQTKGKSRSLKKSFKSIEETYQRYSEYLLARDKYKSSSEPPIDLPHYSPIPTLMEPITECVPVRTCDSSKNQFESPPDYGSIIKKSSKIKAKDKIKEEKISKKKEQRARERMIASQELLQFLPVTFTHEKKYNRCIAALPPHCAVCQILMPHPKDDESIWGTKTNPVDTSQSPNEQRTILDGQNALITSEGELQATADTKPTVAANQTGEFILPEKSQVLLPRSALDHHAWSDHEDESLYKNDGDEKNKIAESPPSQPAVHKEADSGFEDRIKFLNIQVDEPYPLLQCSVCMLSVHSICYGVVKVPEIREDWICDRCIEPTRPIIFCALCPCRGGALKSIDGTWVHINCALTLPNVKLTDLTSEESEKKRKIKLPEPSTKHNCAYCIKTIVKPVQGRCLQCAGIGRDKCPTTFHPICGHRKGAQFEVLDHHEEPAMTYTMIARCAECTDRIRTACKTQSEDEIKPELEPLSIGTRVVALSKKGSYCDGVIQSHVKRTSYEMYFPQANEIDAGVPERNIVGDKSKEFKVGDKVNVKTGAGDVPAKFRRKRCIETQYLIKFKGSVLNERVDRCNIYLNIDQMSEQQVEEYLAYSKKPEEHEFVT